MRAWEIAKILIIIQATLGFISGIGLFDTMYIENPHDESAAYKVGDIDELYKVEEGASMQMGYFDMGVTFVTAGANIIFSVVKSVAFIFPMLVTVFHFPVKFAALLQVAVYLEMGYGVAQWLSNRPGRSFE